MCKCFEMCCSKRQNEDTKREAEHVPAHTVETTLAPLEHHNMESCRDDCTVNALQRNGFVLTPRMAQLREDCRCGNIANIIVDSDVWFRTCTFATSVTSTSVLRSRCWSSLNVSVIQPSHTAAQYCQPCKLRMSATRAPLPCVELIPAQVNSGCAVDRHSQRAA